MDFKPYPVYKDSGVPWLGEVPEGWKIKRLGSVFFERKEKVSEKDFPPVSVTKNGILPQLETAVKTNDGDNRKKVVVGDFVINSRSDRKGSSGLSSLTGSVSLINTVLIPMGIERKYAHRLLKSIPFIEEFFRVGRGIVADLWSTKYADMRTILIPIPPPPEQIQIDRFLDWKTSRIARFIKAKKRMIELLKEQKQVIINDAVTGKIDVTTGKPYPKYKDSGVEWLGEVPEKWEILRLGYVVREIDVRSEYGNEEHLSMSQKSGGLIPSSRLEERRLLSQSYIGGKICFKDNIVLNRLKAHLGVFALAPMMGVISPDYTVLSIIKKSNPRFLENLLKTTKIRSELRMKCKGIVEGFWRLYTDDLYSIKLPLPSLEEQDLIIFWIDRTCETIDFTISRFEREISLMQEYRDRLVADVVTGKVDVRGIEVPEVSEEEPDTDEDVSEEEIDESEEETVEV